MGKSFWVIFDNRWMRTRANRNITKNNIINQLLEGMKHNLLLPLLMAYSLAASAIITQMPGNLSTFPEVWHRPDSLIAMPQEDSISWTDEYTVFTVARSLNDSTAESLWSFAEDDTISTAVLTKGVYMASVGTMLSRNPRDFSKWCVYAYHSGIHADSTKQRSLRLGEQPTYNSDGSQSETLSADIEMEEIAYFGGNVSRHVYGTFQTYLALKYGITLDYAPYISQSGDTLWDPKTDEVFYNRIIGIGNDTVYHWNGYISQSKEDSLLYIQVDSLQPNEYILLGDDNGSPVWYHTFDNEHALQRTWRLRQSVGHPQRITLALCLSAFETIADSMRLVIADIDNNLKQTVWPDSIVGDSLCLFTINSTDTVMHLRLYGVNPHAPLAANHGIGSQTSGSDANSNIHVDINNRTISIDGYPDDQMFVLYLYDNSGKYISSISSRNPIDINKLPYTVFYIEITADNKIVGAINLPMNIL